MSAFAEELAPDGPTDVQVTLHFTLLNIFRKARTAFDNGQHLQGGG
jgi:hypothetical protein